MDIKEFRKQYLDDIRRNSADEGSDPESYFINKTLNDIEELGTINNYTLLPVEIEKRTGRSKQTISFDAWAEDEADSALILIASDFSNEMEKDVPLNDERVSDLISGMQAFIDEAVNGNISQFCDDSNPAVEFASTIRKKMGKSMTTTEIERFKFIIISNKKLSRQYHNVQRPDFLGRPVDLNVWTIERIFEREVSNSSEIIEINTEDFECDGIPCLKADLGFDNEYDAYLGIVPGKFLARIYRSYGSKLLEGNVRAFLSFRGNINKGIKNTIINKPSRFFTFNNGIAIVARAVKFSPDKSKITYFKDLQIINGGQTTAALASVLIKKESRNELETIYVPLKLTVLNVDENMSEEQLQKYNELTVDISTCANTQNAVRPSDFFSNHPFHVKMEQLSRRVMAPPVGSNLYQTTWFYERSRGKWEQEQMKMTDAQSRVFCEKNPKSQVISKEKLAKCYNAILMHPEQVCKSSTDNFKIFGPFIDGIYEKDADNINDVFYKKCVCSVIIFDTLDKLISKQEWYPKGGNKAQITPYTIAKMMTLLPENKDIDWILIWNKQSLYPVMIEELLKLAYFTHRYLEDKAAGGLVRSISRYISTWNDFKAKSYSLSDGFIRTLVSKEEIKDTEKAALRAHKFNSKIDASVEIFKLGSSYWMNIYKVFTKEQLLPPGDCDFIKNVAGYIARGSLLSPGQCKKLMKIVEKAEDKGYVMP